MTTVYTTRSMDKGLIEEITVLSGQNINLCMQCGTCAGSCPMSSAMNLSIRKIIQLSRLGLHQEISGLNAYWTCASCHTCTVRCPRGIDVAAVMESLRQLILRKNDNYIEPSRIDKGIVKRMPQIALVAGFRKMTS